MGGVGKTSALIGLGYDEDVRRHFSDGIHFLRLGQKAMSSTVIKGLAKFVKSSGGIESWKKVQSQGSVGDAVAEAADWFADKTCLFLIDDLWPEKERPQGFLPALKHLLNTSTTSRMAISTRARAIAGDSSQQVLFEPRLAQGDTSRRIFLCHAGLTLAVLGEVDSEIWRLSLEILEFFGGLPIGLAAAGKLLQKHLQESSGRIPQALRILLKQLGDKKLKILDTLVKDTSVMDNPEKEYISFYATISASLEFLDEEQLRSASAGESERMTTSYLFGSLCVMKNQSRIPLSVLERLWDLSYDEALSMVEKFAELSLLEKHVDVRDGTSHFLDVSVSAHDLLIAYAKKMARHSRNEDMWHKKILDSYKCTSPNFGDSVRNLADQRTWWKKLLDGCMCSSPDLDNSVQNSVQNSVPFLASPRPWWTVISDGYAHENLARHLANGGLVAELGGLVTDMRWTKFRLKEGGLLELENDIDTFLKALQDDNTLLREESLSKDIQRIRKALRLSWASIHKNPRECGFQLYGRLCSYRETSTVIAEYLKSIELWNEKPWLRPWRNQRAAEDEWLVTEIRNSGGDAAVWTPDEKGIIYGSGKEIVMFDLIRNEEAFRLQGLEEEVTSLSCTDGTRLISGSLDGTLRIWDLETRAEVREPVRGHSGRVNGVAISLDGKIVISGSRDKTVRLWQFERNDLIEISCETYEDNVDTVVISGDGRRAASSSGNVITVWDTVSMERSCTLRGHIRNIDGLTMCHDGRQLVSGSDDGTVRVWDLDNEEELGPPLFNYSACLCGVTLSRNGHRLAAYFDDGTARVFDMPSRRQIGTPFRQTYTGFPTAALNGDGGRLILATGENICVWDVSDEAELEDGGFGNSSQIYEMAYCQETKTIATVSNHDLYFWDADTGRQLGEPLSSRNGIPLRAVISGDGNTIAVSYSTRKIVIWDVHTRGEIGKCVTRGSWVSDMGISRDGKYIATKSRETLSPRFWDVSASPMATIPAIQVPPHSCQTAISSMENVPNVIHCEGGRISIDIPSPEVLLVNPESDRVVLVSLGEGMRYGCWIVHRGLNGVQVIVVGDGSGGVNWYTLEME